MIRFGLDPNARTPYTKVVFMDENLNPDILRSIPNSTMGAVLLPPPLVVRAYVDSDDINYYTFEYQNYLSLYCRDFISAMIFDAMYNNSDILIVLDSNSNMYMDQILMFMNQVYGFYYNPITGEEYMVNNPNAIMTLRNDLIALCGMNEYFVTSKLFPSAINPFGRK